MRLAMAFRPVSVGGFARTVSPIREMLPVHPYQDYLYHP
jgi:hypothetical protein